MILLASNNTHKIRELSAIFKDQEIMSAQTIIPDFDPEETGVSFLENSLIKAQYLYSCLNARKDTEKLPLIIADDSGISVDALNGEPGIYSARFGQEHGPLNSAEQNSLLLSRLEGIPAGAQRSARYICCMTILADENRVYTVQETWEGKIALEASSGTSGFGYDPIFFLPDLSCTAADISDEEKNRLSHRGKAARAIAAVLPCLLNRPHTY
ncbi:MAG: RdgB/HAM1 family non-canonical purine NTP pyrophosphatase [Salinispira sp.]